MKISFIRIVSLLMVALFLAACGGNVTPESQLSEISDLLSKEYPNWGVFYIHPDASCPFPKIAR